MNLSKSQIFTELHEKIRGCKATEAYSNAKLAVLSPSDAERHTVPVVLQSFYSVSGHRILQGFGVQAEDQNGTEKKRRKNGTKIFQKMEEVEGKMLDKERDWRI